MTGRAVTGRACGNSYIFAGIAGIVSGVANLVNDVVAFSSSFVPVINRCAILVAHNAWFVIDCLVLVTIVIFVAQPLTFIFRRLELSPLFGF